MVSYIITSLALFIKRPVYEKLKAAIVFVDRRPGEWG
jgi:hypothetical protein